MKIINPLIPKFPLKTTIHEWNTKWAKILYSENKGKSDKKWIKIDRWDGVNEEKYKYSNTQ